MVQVAGLISEMLDVLQVLPELPAAGYLLEVHLKDPT